MSVTSALALEDVDIIALSENMDRSKQHLLAFIAWYCGDYSAEHQSADSLIQTNEDLRKWMCLFDGNLGDMRMVNWQFSLYKFGIA